MHTFLLISLTLVAANAFYLDDVFQRTSAAWDYRETTSRTDTAFTSVDHRPTDNFYSTNVEASTDETASTSSSFTEFVPNETTYSDENTTVGNTVFSWAAATARYPEDENTTMNLYPTETDSAMNGTTDWPVEDSSTDYDFLPFTTEAYASTSETAEVENITTEIPVPYFTSAAIGTTETDDYDDITTTAFQDMTTSSQAAGSTWSGYGCSPSTEQIQAVYSFTLSREFRQLSENQQLFVYEMLASAGACQLAQFLSPGTMQRFLLLMQDLPLKFVTKFITFLSKGLMSEGIVVPV